ncbi:MAG: preprotein translocase subunit SecA [Thermoguttaceae bacterium]|nr:preprotein translocase subunit SecA [Thermoguttaceae bacterium]
MGAIPSGITRSLERFLVGTHKGYLARWSYELDKINALEPEVQKLTDKELRKKSLSLRYRARSGEPLTRLLPEAFALVREAAVRNIGMRHFDVQMLGGIAIFNNSIVEMQTGEGKTLTATAPMYLHALSGKGTMLATVNDYLAARDAELMGPVYKALGMKVGVIQTQQPTAQRRDAYQCDITYGTAKEFGFDFLRDRLLLRRIREGQTDILGAMLENKRINNEQPTQREIPYFCLVDEADSILIDEASTPLIISALPTEEQKQEVAAYKWAADNVYEFVEDEDYEYDHEKKTVELTRKGRLKARQLPKPDEMATTGLFHVYEFVQRAIKVDREYKLDQQYVVRDGEIVIVDEFTGRLGEGRKWRDGIHQAVEAKEGVEVTVATGQAARITVQDFFLRFEHLGGMTGTAWASKTELHKIYRCHVIPVPTNRPPRRVKLETLVYPTEKAKWLAIVKEIQELHSMGRAILIGTRTIDKSEILSTLLQKVGIEHQVLNANHIEAEAGIVADAGQWGKVTVSTNMAGRGTDIRLPDEVLQIGGLHVICTELHESARIDRQLIGRCGRQGDPGSYRQYLSLEDEIIEKAYGPKKADKFAAQGEGAEDKLFNNKIRKFYRAQKKVEKKSYRSRKTMLYYEKERKKMQKGMGQDPYLDSTN